PVANPNPGLLAWLEAHPHQCLLSAALATAGVVTVWMMGAEDEKAGEERREEERRRRRELVVVGELRVDPITGLPLNPPTTPGGRWWRYETEGERLDRRLRE